MNFNLELMNANTPRIPDIEHYQLSMLLFLGETFLFPTLM